MLHIVLGISRKDRYDFLRSFDMHRWCAESQFLKLFCLTFDSFDSSTRTDSC